MALTFDASDDEIEATSVGVHGLTEISFGAWLRHSSGTYAISVPVALDSGNGIDIRSDGTNWRAGITTSVAAWDQISAGVIDAGVWHHIGAGLDAADDFRAYRDGVEQSILSSRTGTVKADTDNLGLGVFPSALGRWAGDMAEFFVYSVGLTAREWAALGKGFSPLLIRPDKLLIHIPLVRDIYEVRGLALSTVGTTVADHPPILYPAPAQRWTAAPVAVGGGILRQVMQHYYGGAG